jgi:dephospho-CoA kinase
MLVIVLIGTIGSGKSSVAGILKELGAAVIDSDALARHILDPGTAAYQQVVEVFGRQILDERLGIDRKKLAARVFNHPESLQKLNRIIHPGVDAAVESRLDQYAAGGQKATFVEMAFWAGPGWQKRVDRFWVVKVRRELALQRLAVRGMSEAEVLARLANQPDPEKQISKEVDIINNDGTVEELRQQVVNLWQKIDNSNG